MIRLVRGRTVAIVGRAGSIIGTGNGPAIDAAGVVIRINWLLPVDPALTADIGRRTDLIYRCKRARTSKLLAKAAGVAHYRVSGKYRRRLAERYFKRPADFRPTTGVCAAAESLESGAARVELYGFDLFRSGHVQERMPVGDNYTRHLSWAHSPEEDRRMLNALLEAYPRVLVPDRILTEALK